MSIVNFWYIAHMPKEGNLGKTRDFLFRGFPPELRAKLKVAAALHEKSLQAYLLGLLEEHVRSLERKGLKLSLRERDHE